MSAAASEAGGPTVPGSSVPPAAAHGPTARGPGAWPLLAAVGVGGAVAVAVGAYGSVHDPTGRQTVQLFFSGTLNFKAWAATLVLLLGLFQVAATLRLYGKLRWPASVPSWLGDAHRLSGTLALVVSLPIAYHCLWALGFETDADQTRRFVHSMAGCAFYGAFATKVIVVRSHRMPGWALPVVGGLVFSVLVLAWWTSSLWFFRNVGFPEI